MRFSRLHLRNVSLYNADGNYLRCANETIASRRRTCRAIKYFSLRNRPAKGKASNIYLIPSWSKLSRTCIREIPPCAFVAREMMEEESPNVPSGIWVLFILCSGQCYLFLKLFKYLISYIRCRKLIDFTQHAFGIPIGDIEFKQEFAVCSPHGIEPNVSLINLYDNKLQREPIFKLREELSVFIIIITRNILFNYIPLWINSKLAKLNTLIKRMADTIPLGQLDPVFSTKSHRNPPQRTQWTNFIRRARCGDAGDTWRMGLRNTWKSRRHRKSSLTAATIPSGATKRE